MSKVVRLFFYDNTFAWRLGVYFVHKRLEGLQGYTAGRGTTLAVG
jgi:hypothetical protein